MSNDVKAPKLKSEEEIRSEIISEYELDSEEESNQKFISKLVNERMDTQKKLSTAIKQKINYRNAKDFYKTNAEQAGLDPKTGKPLDKKKEEPNNSEEDKYVTKDELARLELRRQHHNLTDDEFEFVEATAKGLGKKFKDVLDSPIVKNYLETSEVQNRIAGATGAPSSRFKSGTDSEESKIERELDGDLPVGFSSKTN